MSFSPQEVGNRTWRKPKGSSREMSGMGKLIGFLFEMTPTIDKLRLSDKSTYLRLCLFFFLFCFLTFTGCASLPRMKEIYQRLDIEKETPPKIIGPRGQLSPKMSERMMERLKKQTGPTDILERHIALVESISGSPLLAGNKVTLLIDGPATYEAMLKAIQNAKDHINFETYIFDDDEVGRQFADLLLKKQAEGVQVNLIYDSVGCLNTPSIFFQQLQDAGVQTLEFNPVNPLKVRRKWLLTHRDHRKILIVDGSVAFTGGVNISRVYSSSSLSDEHHERNVQEAWRDTQIQIEGPVVAELQKLFLDTWAGEEGPEFVKREYFPVLKREGKDLVQVIGSTPGQENRITYIMYISAFIYAQDFIHLTNSYFVPDRQTIKALRNAAKRGVDVKIILPGISDQATVLYAGRSHYTHLLKSGVKLYEHRDAMLHAKTAVIDGVWSTVGSTNMDLWSFLRNDEVNAIILSRDFAAEMEGMFEKDIEKSNQILLERWKKRPFHDRMKEWLARLFQYWL
jgi:cardiolipin synthase